MELVSRAGDDVAILQGSSISEHSSSQVFPLGEGLASHRSNSPFVTVKKSMFITRKTESLIAKLKPFMGSKTALFIPNNLSNTFTTYSYDMPPKRAHTTNSKRKTTSSTEAGPENSPKKPKTRNDSPSRLHAPDPKAHQAEENGIVLRAFYGPEISNERALAYKNGELPRPVELLDSALSETRSEREGIEVGGAVVHWFKSDLRTRDNRALRIASEKAMERDVPLITMYIVSPQDFEAHLTAPARVDFILRTLRVLKEDLAKLDIPLYVETVEKRKSIPGRILELLGEWGANHLFANVEYEVDELRRDQSLVRACLEKGIAMDVLPDTCVVNPGELVSGSGTQYSVYTPWFRSWVAHLHKNPSLLNLVEEPMRNAVNAREKYGELFESLIPHAPDNKKLSAEEKERFSSMWPPGEHDAQERLIKFADQRIGEYQVHRNFPAEQATSSLSVHLTSGTLSARTAVRTARDHNRTKRLDGGNEGIQAWISEVAWRDFYRHVLAHWPYIWYVPFPLSSSGV
jgi:deoxyribodipyrimidine photo-lyase